mmetsp:Transcript_38503/g.61036  ORF Transcript_38503/g.61036 Transcript_38503/m.61036 type:complete len:518 (-) Transcript_38503:52-1605(-)
MDNSTFLSSFPSTLSSFSLASLNTNEKTMDYPTEKLVVDVVGVLLGGWVLCFVVDMVLGKLVGRKKKVSEKADKKEEEEEKTVESQLKDSASGFFYGNGPIPLPSSIAFFLGSIMLLVLVPIVGFIVGLTVLWDFLDRVGQGRPQDGLVMMTARFINRVTGPLWGSMMRNKEDGFIVNVIILLGVCVPSLFFYCLKNNMEYGFSPVLCLLYHVLRLGPYFMQFAYCYTLCHKEGHSRLGFFKNSVINMMFRNTFNWWVGLFYGVVPSTFAAGHSINHHKYNNGPLDVVSISDKPRDNFSNFVEFLPRFLLYAINVSTLRQFIYQKDYKVAARMFTGTLYYLIWLGCFWRLSPLFTICYLIFPAGENILLLACIQWCWHGFVDERDPENPYVGSITILGGPIDVMSEDYHVVHHQYPGAHWASHEARFKKHKEEYGSRESAVFEQTHAFEMFFLIILKEYRQMAEKYIDYSGKYDTVEKKEKMIKTRLQACWWGPNAAVKEKATQTGWEGVQDSNNYK